MNDPRTREDFGVKWNEMWVYRDPEGEGFDRVVLWNRYDLARRLARCAPTAAPSPSRCPRARERRGARGRGPPPLAALRPRASTTTGAGATRASRSCTARLREHFDRSVRYLPAERKFVVTLRHFRGEIEVEEAAFFVRELRRWRAARIALSDRSEEPLDPATLGALADRRRAALPREARARAGRPARALQRTPRTRSCCRPWRRAPAGSCAAARQATLRSFARARLESRPAHDTPSAMLGCAQRGVPMGPSGQRAARRCGLRCGPPSSVARPSSAVAARTRAAGSARPAARAASCAVSPGIGKSRLLAELGRQALAEGLARLVAAR